MDLRELKVKRATAIEGARAVLNTADAEKRDCTAEEKGQIKKWTDEARLISEDIKVREDLIEQERRVAASVVPEVAVKTDDQKSALALQGFNTYLRSGRIGSGEGSQEFRTLQQNLDTAGGYLVPPEQFKADIIKGLDNAVFMRQLATVIPVTSAKSLGIPSLDTDVSDADWTPELGSISKDTSLAFGKRSLTPHKMTKYISITQELIDGSAIPIETFVKSRLIYKKGVTEENAYLNGTGDQQPLGVMVASAQGINTDRDLATGNTATSLTLDNLKRNKYNIDAAYRAKANWIFHTDVALEIALKKDADGRYMWVDSITANEPSTLFGIPVRESSYMPSTLTPGLYVGILGDFSYYWIADNVNMLIQRLVELGALTDEIYIKLRAFTDGMPMLGAPFSRVTMNT